MTRQIRWALIGFVFLNQVLAEPKTAYDYCFKVGDNLFKTELALTNQQRMTGMMHRTKIDSGQAMLFIFPTPIKASFWMKNTLIPLDILYFDEKMVLKQILNNVPPCKTSICEAYPSYANNIQYVLETNAGESLKQNIVIGDKLRECKN